MQTVGIAPALHHAAGELVDDDDPVVLDDVVGVAGEQFVRPQCLVDVVQRGDAADVVKADTGFQQACVGEQLFGVLGTFVGHGDGADLFVDLVIGLIELGDDDVDLAIGF